MYPTATHPRRPDLSLARSIATLLALGASGAAVHGQCAQSLLFPSDPTANEAAGAATSLLGYTLAVGNPLDDTNLAQSDNRGGVDIYTFSGGTWIHETVLRPSAAAWGQSMGAAVDLWGQFCLAGAPYLPFDDSDGFSWQVGGVYVFSRFNGVWSQLTLLALPGDPAANFASEFGRAVALDGEYAVVGAPGYPWDADHIPGRAFLFRRESPSTWVLEDALPPNDISGWYDLRFGEVVAMERGASNATTFAMVGVPRFDLAGSPDCGEVMVYTKPASGSEWGNGWQVIPSDIAAGDRFGTSVDADGLTMVVGAPGSDHNGLSAVGAAYVFVRSPNGVDWNQVAKLPCPDQVAGAAFGSSVAIDGDRIVVGSPSLGRVYVYEKTGALGLWLHDRTLVDPAATDGDTQGMGSSVGVYGDTVAAGNPQHNYLLLPNTGAAHLFALGAAAGNDACAAAEQVVANGSYDGCTVGASSDGGQTCTPSSNGTPDVWFQYTAPSDGTLTFDTFGSALDTVLSVHDGCPGTIFNVVGCNDDLGAFFSESAVTVELVAGHTYRVRVGGKSGQVGAFTLNVGAFAPACPSDLDGDGAVSAADLSVLLGAWGAARGVPADLDQSGTVDSADLAILLGAWGACH